MMPLFLKLTAVSGLTVYVNFNAVATFTEDVFDDKPITTIFFINDDEPIAVTEAPNVIREWLDMEAAEQKERIDCYRAKLIDERK